jgi:hypothetical protein
MSHLNKEEKMQMRITHRPWRALAVLALAAGLGLTASVEVSATQRGAQRYPRVWNSDGTARCYPDGCDPFGMCCS